MRGIVSLLLSFLLCIPVSAGRVPAISAESAVLVEADSMQIVYSRYHDRKMQPASMTKIMTALIVIENCPLDEEVTVTEEAVGIEGSSACLRAGEVFTVRELLYALLLQSANDAAVALALHLCGMKDFVALMNEKAADIGMTGSHFKNPHGLTDKDHYGTAYDYALLLCHCMKNGDFAAICGCRQYTAEPGLKRYGRTFTNHNRLLFTCDGVRGGKTGYTRSSGRCLCSYYEKDGVRLCAVTMNAPSDWTDHAALYGYGASLYERVTLSAAGTYSLHVVGGINDTATCTVGFDVYATVRKGGEIKKTVCMRRFEYAPVAVGERIGCLIFTSDGRVIKTVPLYADNKVEQKTPGFLKDLLIWKK
ncbi:MAG: D-alanyl-D-alanine carboxypeptidase [Clostridia bacterium]|nr:D-alanyl-D-alanine carboxypeptidase [Clostridia bacterium]